MNGTAATAAFGQRQRTPQSLFVGIYDSCGVLQLLTQPLVLMTAYQTSCDIACCMPSQDSCGLLTAAEYGVLLLIA